MITAARECPSCRAPLPADAEFCHKCGSATPTGIDQATGEVQTIEHSGLAESVRRQTLQNALGDSCEVRRLLGRGGFAEVYVAFDKRLKREIAVKTIRGDLVVNEMLLERFQREAEAVAKLRHPNVVPIYSVGESGGIAYFTMPLIEGESLGAALEREGRLPLPESVRILREAAHALHAAHRVGIVHRDVKPDNIMLEGPERSVVVMDFGIAKTAGGADKGLTGTGMLVGTPHYMSPEQAMGEKTLDARSDQYALAAVGYRMLTGRGPFEGESVQTLIFKTVTEVPPPACEVSPDVAVELSDALAKALSKRPEDRYESMSAFAASLSAFERPADASGVRARGRTRVPLSERARLMRATVPTLLPWLLGAIPLCAAAIWLFTMALPVVPLVVARNRDEAIFTAKTFLNARGAAGGREEFARFVSRDSVFEFLQKQLGFAGMQQRAMTDAPVWSWKVVSVSPGAKDQWIVWVGPDNRITAFENVLADTSTAAVHHSGQDSSQQLASAKLVPVAFSADSARSLAQSELLVRGWLRSRLEQLPDSTITRKARTDYLFRWRERTGAIPWRAGDSAFVRIVIAVSGNRVIRFVQDVRMPDTYPDTRSPVWLGPLLTLFSLLGIVLAVVVTMKHVRAAEIEWGGVTRLLCFALAAVLIPLLPNLYENVVTARSTGGTWYVTLVLGAVMIIVLGAPALWFAAAGESLAYDRKPAVVSGINDVARRWLIIPEMVPAAARGYLLGALYSLVSALGLYASVRLGIGKPGMQTLPFSMPLLDGLFDPSAMAIVLAFALLFGVTASYRVPYLSRVALAVPTIVGLMGQLASGERGAMVLTGAISVALLTYVLWRYGMFTVIVAVLVAEAIERSVALVSVGDSRSLLGAAAVLTTVALPGVAALIALRRFSESGSAAATLDVHSRGVRPVRS